MKNDPFAEPQFKGWTKPGPRPAGANGEPGESVCIELAGEKAGQWHDHNPDAVEASGDLLTLWALSQGYATRGEGFALAVNDLEQHLGLGGRAPASFGRVAQIAAERAALL